MANISGWVNKVKTALKKKYPNATDKTIDGLIVNFQIEQGFSESGREGFYTSKRLREMIAMPEYASIAKRVKSWLAKDGNSWAEYDKLGRNPRLALMYKGDPEYKGLVGGYGGLQFTEAGGHSAAFKKVLGDLGIKDADALSKYIKGNLANNIEFTLSMQEEAYGITNENINEKVVDAKTFRKTYVNPGEGKLIDGKINEALVGLEGTGTVISADSTGVKGFKVKHTEYDSSKNRRLAKTYHDKVNALNKELQEDTSKADEIAKKKDVLKQQFVIDSGGSTNANKGLEEEQANSKLINQSQFDEKFFKEKNEAQFKIDQLETEKMDLDANLSPKELVNKENEIDNKIGELKTSLIGIEKKGRMEVLNSTYESYKAEYNDASYSRKKELKGLMSELQPYRQFYLEGDLTFNEKLKDKSDSTKASIKKDQDRIALLKKALNNPKIDKTVTNNEIKSLERSIDKLLDYDRPTLTKEQIEGFDNIYKTYSTDAYKAKFADKPQDIDFNSLSIDGTYESELVKERKKKIADIVKAKKEEEQSAASIELEVSTANSTKATKEAAEKSKEDQEKKVESDAVETQLDFLSNEDFVGALDIDPTIIKEPGVWDALTGDALSNAASAITGFIGYDMANDDINTDDGLVISNEFLQHVDNLKRVSELGLDPAEEASMKKDLGDGYAAMMENAVRASGGNRAAILGTIGQADANMASGMLKIAEFDSQRKYDAMQRYGDALEQLDAKQTSSNRIKEQRDYDQAMAKKQVGAKLMGDSIGNILDSINYQMNEKPLHDAYMAKMRKEAGIYTNKLDAQLDVLNKGFKSIGKTEQGRLLLNEAGITNEIWSNKNVDERQATIIQIQNAAARKKTKEGKDGEYGTGKDKLQEALDGQMTNEEALKLDELEKQNDADYYANLGKEDTPPKFVGEELEVDKNALRKQYEIDNPFQEDNRTTSELLDFNSLEDKGSIKSDGFTLASEINGLQNKDGKDGLLPTDLDYLEEQEMNVEDYFKQNK